MKASVVITTKNRRDELVTALTSVFAQTASCEVLVIDDASTDGTSEMVREKFPGARVVRHEASKGLIVGRNEAAGLVTGDVIFSIDDDAEFSTPRVVEQTLAEFDHPRVAAVGIPYADVRKSPTIYQRARADDGGLEVLPQYIGTAHAVLRSAFVAAGGYRESLFHQGEEMDLSIRLLARGLVVRAGRADPIWHYESPNRDLTRVHIYGRRNDIFYAWHNVPGLMMPVHMAATAVGGMRMALAGGFARPAARGLIKGVCDLPTVWGARDPVPMAVYRVMRHLRRHAPVPLAEIEAKLPRVV